MLMNSRVYFFYGAVLYPTRNALIFFLKEHWGTWIGLSLGVGLSLFLQFITQSYLAHQLKPWEQSKPFAVLEWHEAEMPQTLRLSEPWSSPSWSFFSEHTLPVYQWPKFQAAESACVISVSSDIFFALTGLKLEQGRWPHATTDVVAGAHLAAQWHFSSESAFIWSDVYHSVKGILQPWMPLPGLSFDFNECFIHILPSKTLHGWNALLLGLPDFASWLHSLDTHSGLFRIHYSHERLQAYQQHAAQQTRSWQYFPYILWLLSALNLAQMQYARLRERQYEWAVCLTLGAQPWHLGTQCVFEMMGQCLVSGIIGIGLGVLLIACYDYLYPSTVIIPILWKKSLQDLAVMGLMLSVYPALKVQQWDILPLLRH